MRYAVVDGPEGTHWVFVPAERSDAQSLRARHSARFWCSTKAGGCGAQLSLKAGTEKKPHFAHYPGQAENCRFAYDFDALERSYLHLALQLTLKKWLADLGLDCTLGVLKDQVNLFVSQ